MKSILNLFWQICLLRQSPAYVPTYGWFVVVVVLANPLCSVLISRAVDSSVGVLRTATGVIVAQTVTAGLVYLSLTAKNLTARFVTTVTALFGCDLLITACLGLLLPVAALFGAPAVTLAMLAFLIWSVAVAGFVMHRALDVPLGLGIGIAIGIMLMSVTLGQLAIGA